ncbi:MAG TPA: isochorismatase family cysteine hydrolase [Bryobacteraceae bacterium]|nr:isochorismatase family cysteine hydrolase [Bryobacteraceae bacterium]
MKTVFFDIDTQIDFLYPAGALYVPGAERLLPQFAELNRFAEQQGITVISTTDAHAENDPEFKRWPAHCVAGTAGQHKPESTLLAKRTVVPTTPGKYDVSGAQQIIIEKQELDAFTNPNLRPLLDELAADRYVVYGVVTEFCVRCVAMGLLRTGKRVEIVSDAIETLDEDHASRTLGEFTSARGKLTTVDEVLGRE